MMAWLPLGHLTFSRASVPELQCHWAAGMERASEEEGHWGVETGLGWRVRRQGLREDGRAAGGLAWPGRVLAGSLGFPAAAALGVGGGEPEVSHLGTHPGSWSVESALGRAVLGGPEVGPGGTLRAGARGSSPPTSSGRVVSAIHASRVLEDGPRGRPAAPRPQALPVLPGTGGQPQGTSRVGAPF